MGIRDNVITWIGKLRSRNLTIQVGLSHFDSITEVDFKGHSLLGLGLCDQ